MYGCELDYKESWVPKNWCFWTVVLGVTLESLIDCNQSILKEISPEYSLEGLMFQLKVQYFGYLMRRTERPWCWERLRARGEGGNRRWDGWMASLTWWTWVWTSSRVGDGQGSLACCSCKEQVMKSRTWLSDWTKLNQSHWRNSVHILKEGRICHLKIDPIIRVIVGWLFLRSCRHRKNSET